MDNLTVMTETLTYRSNNVVFRPENNWTDVVYAEYEWSAWLITSSIINQNMALHSSLIQEPSSDNREQFSACEDEKVFFIFCTDNITVGEWLLAQRDSATWITGSTDHKMSGYL